MGNMVQPSELVRDEMKYQTRRARILRNAKAYDRLLEVNQARRGLAVIHRLIVEGRDYVAVENAIRSTIGTE